MVVKTCPRCNQNYSIQDYDKDYVHECVSDNDALSKEDVVRTDVDNWNLQGIGTKVIGENVDEINKWGHRTSTHKERSHSEYIEV